MGCDPRVGTRVTLRPSESVLPCRRAPEHGSGCEASRSSRCWCGCRSLEHLYSAIGEFRKMKAQPSFAGTVLRRQTV